jgi:FtsP/CotA-like multicopper oxidase with cupredoxin domain
MTVDRREFLKCGGLAALGGIAPAAARAAIPMHRMSAMGPSPSTISTRGIADYTIRIGPSLIEYAPQSFLSMTTYNGDFPGPLMRFTAGRQTVVDIYNDTDTPEQLHWHGQFLPTSVDGAAEEGTPYIPPHGMRREMFTPGPAGLRFYHTHLAAGADLNRGQYHGEVGTVYIEPRDEAGSYDREVFLMLKEFAPYLSTASDMDGAPFLLPGDVDASLHAAGQAADGAARAKGRKAYDLDYQIYTINGRQLGFGDPIKVKRGERVMFHIVNGSATEIRSLYLPGHVFSVVALDGNPVPTQAEVPVLWLGAAERISAIVEMRQPGVWVLGDTDDMARSRGMGIVVEYAGATGRPMWQPPTDISWDYRRFANPNGQVEAPDEIIDMVFTRDLGAVPTGAGPGFNLWKINGVSFDMRTMPVMWTRPHGRRYRLRMRNATGSIHPIHLHRNTFEITSIAGHPTAGVRKDVAMIGGYQTLAVDFTPELKGRSLFHCHMQSHMDYGFMALFEFV